MINEWQKITSQRRGLYQIHLDLIKEKKCNKQKKIYDMIKAICCGGKKIELFLPLSPFL